MSSRKSRISRSRLFSLHLHAKSSQVNPPELLSSLKPSRFIITGRATDSHSRATLASRAGRGTTAPAQCSPRAARESRLARREDRSQRPPGTSAATFSPRATREPPGIPGMLEQDRGALPTSRRVEMSLPATPPRPSQVPPRKAGAGGSCVLAPARTRSHAPSGRWTRDPGALRGDVRCRGRARAP